MVPQMLLAPCEAPVWQGGTNADLVEYIASLREALGRCNADKAAVKILLNSEE